MLKAPHQPKKLLAKNIEEYFLEEVGLHSRGSKIEYESHDYSPAIELLRYREEIACLDNILDKERKKHAEKQEEFRQRWNAAAEQMKSTDEAIVSLDDRYQEAIDDRQRQLTITARQDDLRIGKEKDIRRLEKEYAVLDEVRTQTTDRLEQFKPVEKYLERVRDMSQGEFRTIRELLDRFNLLKDTRYSLMDRENTARELIGRRQNLLEGLTSVKGNESVLLNNYIFELTEELENLTSKEQRLDEELANIKTTTAQRTTNLSKVRLAVFNLYRQACKMMNRNAIIPPIDTVRQLNYIRGSLLEINKVRRRLQFIMKLAIESHKKEVKEKEKAERAEQQRQRYVQKTGRTRDQAAVFGVKGAGGGGEPDDGDRQFSNYGKAKAVWGSGNGIIPVMGRGGAKPGHKSKESFRESAGRGSGHKSSGNKPVSASKSKPSHY